jgi:hypothetical protein
LGASDMHNGGPRRPPGGAHVGEGGGLPVGCADMQMGGSGGHLEVLRWARETGCPWDKAAVMTESPNQEMRDWVAQQDDDDEEEEEDWDEEWEEEEDAGEEEDCDEKGEEEEDEGSEDEEQQDP